VPVDVADEEQVTAMVAATVRRFGRLDVLHNNAAAVSPEHLASDHLVCDVELANWDRTMAVNLRGALLGCRAAIPVMLANGGGSIINSSSRAGTFGSRSGTAYGVSKAGLEHLTLDVAVQYGKQGIRCNAIAIFGIVTANFQRSLDDAGIARRLASALTPHLGTPADVANAALFLASDEARYITGHTLAVDGGMSAGSPRTRD
jgi:NAD(P)-dependent dehydrogenase (short-subunit alcohol dehydrogenase family)